MYLQKLIPLLNMPIVGVLFRRALWINDHKNKIIKLLPYTCHVQLEGRKKRATIYINNQYDEAARKNLGWLLSLLHFLDTYLLNRLKPAWNLGFDDYSSQPDESSGIDTFLDQKVPTGQYGTYSYVQWGEFNNTTGARNYICIKYGLTSIASGAEISAATLTLTHLADFSNASHPFNLHRSLRVWVETQATYNIWSTGNNWTTAGAKGAGTDKEAQIVAATSPSASPSAGDPETWEFNNLGDYVEIEAMVGASPSFTNNGWIGSVGADVNDGHRFDSSSSSTAEERPLLEITYTLPIIEVVKPITTINISDILAAAKIIFAVEKPTTTINISGLLGSVARIISVIKPITTINIKPKLPNFVNILHEEELIFPAEKEGLTFPEEDEDLTFPEENNKLTFTD